MEYFEKAHVAKKEFSKKENKTEVAVKKQLKQMLHGYKQSDIKLIRESEHIDAQKYNEDSSSVSGFSDLNLTSSSNEDDIHIRTISSISEESNVTFPNKNEDMKVNLDDSNSVSLNTAESISECKEDIESISGEDLSLNVNDESLPSDLSDNISLISSMMESVTELDSDESEFDANGILASKILKKLEQNEKFSKKKKQPLKGMEINIECVKDDKVKKLTKHKVDVHVNNKLSVNEELYNSFSDDNSSPFVSVTATQMEVDQSFSEILGNYKHSTVSNMPSDNQIVTHSINSCNIFSVDNMTLENVSVQKGVNELTDEYDTTGDNVKDITDSNTLPEEESTNYDDTLQSEQTFERELSTESTDKFVNPIKVYNRNNVCVIVLKHPAEIFVHGKVSVQLLGGKIDIFGYTLNDEKYEVYAPNCHYAQRIKTVENQNEYYGLFGKLSAAGLAVYEAEEIVTDIGEHDGIIKLSQLIDHKIDFVENHFKVADLFTKSSKNMEYPVRNACDILKCSLYLSKPWKHFEEIADWEPVIQHALDRKSRGIICGGKGLGKSTFLRYCVNRQLAHGPVLVIDLDPGQAEFTVAGNISATIVTKPLLGPNFTHLETPQKMLHIGMINTMDNTRRYAAAIAELIHYCHNNKSFQTLPWIVNTMGMCNVVGLKFMLLTILRTQPTYLLQIDSKNPKKRFAYHLTSNAVRQLYSENYHDTLFRNIPFPEGLEYNFFISGCSEISTNSSHSLSPRDDRYLNYLAYFGSLLSAKKQTLLGITPYEVNYQDLYIGFNIRVDKNAVLNVINGKVVALCQVTQDKAGQVFTLTDKPLLCHGYGLIRNIDQAKKVLYIITSNQSGLTLTNAIVYADWVPELVGMEKHLPEGQTVPYRTASVYQQRQLMFAPRRRFNPLQLLKMSRRNT
ncbi:polynucleotide 5'-hydroxyl-kinase NOL9 isoform X2 [Achroia grisella]|nr:polynucleotide 5'-hydroxyl-kinase NOL9 isoform X2 [Achroia grisella]